MPPGGSSCAPLGPCSQYSAHVQVLPQHVLGLREPYEHNWAILPNINLGDAGYLSWPFVYQQLNYHQVDRRSASQEAHGYGDKLHSCVPWAQNPVPISYQVSTQELWARQQQQPQAFTLPWYEHPSQHPMLHSVFKHSKLLESAWVCVCLNCQGWFWIEMYWIVNNTIPP